MMIRNNNILNQQQYLQRFTSNKKSKMAIIPHKTRTTRSFSSNIMRDTNSNNNSNIEQQHQQLVKMPSNLWLDPRSKSSPFYGLDPVVDPLLMLDNIDDDDDDDNIEDDIDIVDINDIIDNDKVASNDNNTTNMDQDFFDNEDEEDEEEDEEDDEEEDSDEKDILYDITKRPEPVYAIPLPQRLHVPILHFSASPINNSTSNNDTTDTTDITNTHNSNSNSNPNKHHATEAGTIHLQPSIFGQNPIRIDILHKCIIYHRNKRRGKRNAGARTKTISEVRGSGRKVRKQKGGGVARAGHARPPHWRGGAKAHGPKGDVQDYTTKL